MFSGIIEAIGKIKTIENCDGDKRISIDTDQFAITDVKTGESISVNGVCLTLVEHYKQGFITDVSNETLACTIFAELQVGSKVNLEKALRLDSRLNGHMVSGHVDGVGIIQKRTTDGRSERFVISIPEGLSRYICKKGSVCVSGVSLTVNNTNSSSFAVNIIPHTLKATIFADLVQGDRVNIEVDIIARYLEALHTSYK
jgi:riboflavin synthase